MKTKTELFARLAERSSAIEWDCAFESNLLAQNFGFGMFVSGEILIELV